MLGLDVCEFRPYSLYMHDTTASNLLMIEPTVATTKPVIDSLVRRLTAAYRIGRSVDRTRGVHISTAKPQDPTASRPASDNCTHVLTCADGSELHTNSLAIHYLAHCRAEVPASEIEKLDRLPLTEAEPTVVELWPGGGWW